MARLLTDPLGEILFQAEEARDFAFVLADLRDCRDGGTGSVGDQDDEPLQLATEALGASMRRPIALVQLDSDLDQPGAVLPIGDLLGRDMDQLLDILAALSRSDSSSSKPRRCPDSPEVVSPFATAAVKSSSSAASAPEISSPSLPPIALHGLRHCAATLGLAAGLGHNVVNEVLGHSSTKLAMDTYSNILEAMFTAAVEKISKLIPRNRIGARSGTDGTEMEPKAERAPGSGALETSTRW